MSPVVSQSSPPLQHPQADPLGNVAWQVSANAPLPASANAPLPASASSPCFFHLPLQFDWERRQLLQLEIVSYQLDPKGM